MSATHAALLRGINVGKAKRVSMAELRTAVQQLGYGGVRTLLNSGNLVFEAPDADPNEAALLIERAVLDRAGVSSRVTVITAEELAEAVAGNPLLSVGDDPSRLHVAFLADPADRRALEPLAQRNWAPEALALGARVAYLWCPAGVTGSALVPELERKANRRITLRNWSTVMKLQALMAD